MNDTMSGAEFILAAIVFLMLLMIASYLAVWAVEAIYRSLCRWSSWWDSRRSLRVSARRVRALKRRYGPARDKSPSPLGKLRFTRSRAKEFDGPPDYHGKD